MTKKGYNHMTEKQEFFVVENKGNTAIECEWMELGGVDKLYLDVSDIYKNEGHTRTRVEGCAFVMTGDGVVTDHTALPVPVRIKTPVENIRAYEAVDMEEAANIALEENGKESIYMESPFDSEIYDTVVTNPFKEDIEDEGLVL